MIVDHITKSYMRQLAHTVANFLNRFPKEKRSIFFHYLNELLENKDEEE